MLELALLNYAKPSPEKDFLWSLGWATSHKRVAALNFATASWDRDYERNQAIARACRKGAADHLRKARRLARQLGVTFKWDNGT